MCLGGGSFAVVTVVGASEAGVFDTIFMVPVAFGFDPPVRSILCATGVVVVCCVAVGSAASLETFFDRSHLVTMVDFDVSNECFLWW